MCSGAEIAHTYVAVCRLSLRESMRTFAERRATFVRLKSLTYFAVCRLSLRESMRTFAERRATFVRLESLTHFCGPTQRIENRKQSWI